MFEDDEVPAALQRAVEHGVGGVLVPSTGPADLARVPLPHIKLLLADLEAMTTDAATPDDYVDLGETKTFVPEVTEGECAT
jgi:hypothetical protein